MNKQKRFNEIIRDILSIKIQGARNIAKQALFAYFLFPNKNTIKKLISLRPTEPMLSKVLLLAEKIPKEQILLHFDESQNKINKNVLNLIKSKDKIFTHCHSTNVVNSLIYAKKQGKQFEVINTETRPLFQGRKTSKELSKAKIKVTMFIDSAIDSAIEKEGKFDKIFADKIFLGADALLKEGIINKVGSKTIAELAYLHKIPVYILADSWKFSKNKIPIEERKLNEVWDNAPKHIKIKNPAFEFVNKKYITKIVTELGIMNYSEFVRNN